MKKKILFGFITIAFIVLNTTILLEKADSDINISILKFKDASADREYPYPTYPDPWDQGCSRCGEGRATYYCVGGTGGCFSSGGCVGGIC